MLVARSDDGLVGRPGSVTAAVHPADSASPKKH